MFRARPVRIGVPQNVWTHTVPAGKLAERPAELGATVRTDERAVERAAAMVEEADYPVLFAGIGAAQAVEPLLDLRSEEHTSALQSRENLVCRLLLEKNK